ncbi:MAG: hypothetical protein O2970_11485 [Proteobacteria bacterium]|nr:hypothetical protein [Pseudomonadota bacterium]
MKKVTAILIVTALISGCNDAPTIICNGDCCKRNGFITNEHGSYTDGK